MRPAKWSIVVLNTCPQNGASGAAQRLAASEVLPLHLAPLRAGEELDGELEHLAHSDAALRAHDGDRQELLRRRARGDAADDLLGGERAALEVLAEQLVIGLGRGLDERGPEPLRLCLE